MALQDTVLSFDDINFSAQVGDIIYYSHSGSGMGGFNSTALVNTRKLGEIISITPNVATEKIDISVRYDPSKTVLPSTGDYISFVKDKKANTSSLLGYYASVKFVNDSTDKVELFSIGSEISESSK
tara:strand:- start:328 stop:705 length:378 start_codon:yes stop_codon:yes gene_type:complete